MLQAADDVEVPLRRERKPAEGGIRWFSSVVGEEQLVVEEKLLTAPGGGPDITFPA
ncbi:hypothetical protein [Pseudarthrobacter sp. IC2-21]|uniref:hypothetical protein n=1 Tax=Pseudarthrobacter sp. IC2-21 TaxID=3092262 RepID=UPI002A69E1F7|nr:hypothetical protein [Pseudarthrobacter sp. IC2-21]